MRTFFLSALMLFFIPSFAQHFSNLVSFDDFNEWVESANISNYNYSGSELDGDIAFGESVSYSASFMSSDQNRGLSVSMDNITEFDQFSAMAGQFGFSEITHGGYTMVYFKLEAKHASSWLAVKIPNINACLSFIASPVLDQNKLIGIFERMEIDELVGRKAVVSKINWPEEIPQDARLVCDIINIEKTGASTDGISYEYHVYVAMGDDLLNSLKEIKSVYGGDLTYTDINGKFMFICPESESIEYLKEDKRQNQTVEFIYYKRE